MLFVNDLYIYILKLGVYLIPYIITLTKTSIETKTIAQSFVSTLCIQAYICQSCVHGVHIVNHANAWQTSFTFVIAPNFPPIYT